MPLQVCPLGSGSSGNAIYIGDGKSNLLIDCGFTGRELEKRLLGIGVCMQDLDGIILTHEHRDHSQGAGVIARRWRIPLYSRPGTWAACNGILGRIPGSLQRELISGLAFGHLVIEYFPLPHDASEPVGLEIHWRKRRIMIATDLGHVPTSLVPRFENANAIILEANHDLSMLENGSYPYPLKKRIKGPLGHLSNDDCGSLLQKVLGGVPTTVILAHLSQDNNVPDIARITVANMLQGVGLDLRRDVQLLVAARDCHGPMIGVS